jgi:hypothetical protein
MAFKIQDSTTFIALGLTIMDPFEDIKHIKELQYASGFRLLTYD